MPEHIKGSVQQPLPDQPPSIDPAVIAAQQDLATGIQMLTRDWPRLVIDFAYCAGLLAGAPDAPTRIVEMMEFARAYHRHGLEVTADAIEKTSGVPVKIEMLRRPDPRVSRGAEVFRTENPPQTRDGLIVSIVGAEIPEGRQQNRHLHAIALMENILGQELFVPVSLYPNGRTVVRSEIYNPAFQEKFNTPKRMIEALFPPTHRRQGGDGGTRRGGPERHGRAGGERGRQRLG